MLQVRLALIVLILVGCSDPSDFAKDPIVNKSNQVVTFVREDTIHGWVKEHLDIKIIAMTSYRGGNNDGYIVVYENIKVEK